MSLEERFRYELRRKRPWWHWAVLAFLTCGAIGNVVDALKPAPPAPRRLAKRGAAPQPVATRRPEERPTGTPAPAVAKDSSGNVAIDCVIGYLGGAFIVMNNDPFDWTDVKLDVNGGLWSSGWVVRLPRVKAKAGVTIRAEQLAKGDGQMFNPATHRPLHATISCETPYGHGFHYNEWP